MHDVREVRMPSPPRLPTGARGQAEEPDSSQEEEPDETPEAVDTADISTSLGKTEEQRPSMEEKRTLSPPREDQGSLDGRAEELSSSKGVFHASGVAQQPQEAQPRGEYVDTSHG